MRKMLNAYVSGCLVVCLLLLGLNAPLHAQEALPESTELRDFHLISENTGWLLLDQRLYWTTNGGTSWAEVTPAELGQAEVRAVFFLDAQQGWLIASNVTADGSPAYTVLRTADGGVSWQRIPLSLFEPGAVQAIAQTVSMQFINEHTGWIVFKQATSSNFNVGTLFKTTDGGATWAQLTIPIGEPVYFISENVGWTAGGTAGDELYRTQDGGATWTRQTVTDAALSGEQQVSYHLPTFSQANSGILPVTVADGDATLVKLYRTDDGGQTWTLADTLNGTPSLATGRQLPLSVFDAAQWTFIAPDTQQVVSSSPAVGKVAVSSQDDLLHGIQSLDMATPEVGWAHYSAGTCTASASGIECTSEIRVLRTSDGGQSWASLTLPGVNAPSIEQAFSVSTPAESETGDVAVGKVNNFVGQGFDTCEIPTLSQLQNWIKNSPYRAVNLYIGGSSRACRNSALSASYIDQLQKQGWKFIPTWVGPQAACTGYRSRMSYDAGTSYNQGQQQADAALSVAANLGLTSTIIYYDLEAYNTGNTACREAAKSFISGWTKRIREKGHQSGVYGSTCGSGIAHFAGISHVPNAIWPAAWYSDYRYRSNASVWNLSCLSNDLWSSHQRIRQYAGGHNETWGGVTLNIDSNVIDGVIAEKGASVPDYAAEYVTQAYYPENVVPGQDSEWWIEFKNTGSKTWYKTGTNAVRLGTGTYSHNDIIYSDIYHGHWQNPARPALMDKDSVAPGQVARFSFQFHVPANAPTTAWSKNYNFTPVAERITWIKDTYGNEINAFMKIKANGVFQPDAYEYNNTESSARLLPLLFSNNTAVKKTSGANLHNSSDIDYYKLDLPAGYTYTVTVRLHNSWQSSDGRKYSGDTKYFYKNGSSWSSGFGAGDGVKQFQMTNGGIAYFKVDRYAPGNTGTYALDLSVTRTSNSTGKPDLIVSSLRAVPHPSYSGSYRYEYTIKNIGTAEANLDGPTAVNHDNVSVQAMLSTDAIFGNADDRAAGGTIIGLSPLGELAPGATFSGSFGSFAPGGNTYLILMVDWGRVIGELNESNNTRAVRLPVTLQAPTGVSATDGVYTEKVRVTWNSVTGATYYRVYRNTSNTLSGAVSVSGWRTGTMFDDYSASPGRTYFYWVKAATSSRGANASGVSASNGGYRRQLARFYRLTTCAGYGGIVMPSGSIYVNAGSNVRFRIYSRSGFTIHDIIYDGRSIYAGRGYNYRHALLTISNVSRNHTVRVYFRPIWMSGLSALDEPGAAAGLSLGHDDDADLLLEPADAPEDLFSDEEIPDARIVASADTQGAIFPDGTLTLDSGSDQTFVITPAPGYAIQDVLVDGESVGAVEEYIFSEVSGEHTIHATFEANAEAGGSYFGFEEFGGSWQDAEKTLANPDDDWLCWAAAASNILDWTGWNVFDSVQDAFYTFQNYWTDAGGLMEYGWQWWFDGTEPPDQQGWAQLNDGWAEADNGGSFWADDNFFEYFYEDWAWDSMSGQWGDGTGLMASIDQYLHSGYGTTLAVYSDSGGHALTAWGYEYDASGNYTGVYVTDSDDYTTDLKLLSVSLVDDRWYLDQNNDYGYQDWFIGGVQALDHKPVPEPGTLVLIALGLLNLMILLRKNAKNKRTS